MSTDEETRTPLQGRAASEKNLKIWPNCGAAKKNGQACKGAGTLTTSDGPRCPHHSGRYSSEEKSEWGQRGSLATNHGKLVKRLASLSQADDLEIPDLHDSQAVEAFLAKTVAEVRQGKLPPSLARTINELIQTRLKLVELDQARKLVELEAELRDEQS